MGSRADICSGMVEVALWEACSVWQSAAAAAALPGISLSVRVSAKRMQTVTGGNLPAWGDNCSYSLLNALPVWIQGTAAGDTGTVISWIFTASVIVRYGGPLFVAAEACLDGWGDAVAVDRRVDTLRASGAGGVLDAASRGRGGSMAWLDKKW